MIILACIVLVNRHPTSWRRIMSWLITAGIPAILLLVCLIGLYKNGVVNQAFGGKPLSINEMIADGTVHYEVIEHSKTIYLIRSGQAERCYQMYVSPPLDQIFVVLEDGDGNRHFVVQQAMEAHA